MLRQLSQVLGTGSMPNSALDLLTLSATKARELLQEGTITSAGLIELYLTQIENHNNNGLKLNAVIQTAPRETLMTKARQLDAERASGNVRSPLHGVPIIVKDAFLTPSLGMATTCGSVALRDQYGVRDAKVIELLAKAGLIVIAKANLSEWGSYKAYNLTGGWSAVGGQTRSPYVTGDITYPIPFLSHYTPAGSSSGSSISVAAGFAPLALGAETDGSIVQPANRAAVYGLKATLGSVSMSGVMPGASSLDCLGGFAKSPHDLVDLMSIIMELPFRTITDTNWSDLRVGFVDPSLWKFPTMIIEQIPEFREQLENELASALQKISSLGAKVAYPVQLVQYDELFTDIDDANDVDSLIAYEFPQLLERFLQLFPASSVKSLADLIKFNEDHAAEELPLHQPLQDRLIDMNNSKISKDQFDSILSKLRARAISEIDQTLRQYDVDVILGPGDARFCSFAAAAGSPIASLPLGFANFNGRAFSAHALVRPGEEQKLLRVMAAWEKTFPDATKPPPRLTN